MKKLIYYLILCCFTMGVKGQEDLTEELRSGNLDIKESGKYIIKDIETENYITIWNTSSNIDVILTLENVKIKTTAVIMAPINAMDAESLTLKLKGKNELIGTNVSSGISAPQKGKSSLIIEDSGDNDGELIVQGNGMAAGIALTSKSNPSLTIKSGKIKISGGNDVSGIKGGIDQNDAHASINIVGGDITIEGGGNNPAIELGTISSSITGIKGTFKCSGNSIVRLVTGGNDYIKMSGLEEEISYDDCILIKNNAGEVYGNMELQKDLTLGYSLNLESTNNAALTIPEGKTLTIPESFTLTNGGTITNNGTVLVDGKLTNNSTITNKGIVKVDKGSFDGSSTLYTVTFDDNVDDSSVKNMPPNQGVVNGRYPIAPLEIPTRLGYGFKGWGTTEGATDLVTDWNAQTISEAKTYYAIWGKSAEISFTETSYSFKYGDSNSQIKAEATINTTKQPDENITYTFYEDKACTVTLKEKPVNVGTYWVRASYPGADGLVDALSDAVAYTITPRVLAIAPLPDQYVYKNEIGFEPRYQYSHHITSEFPSFTGRLSWDSNGNYNLGSLQLVDKGAFLASNYKLAFNAGNATITIKQEEISDAKATASENSVINGWQTQDFTLTAPVGFTFKEEGSILKSISYDKKEITISEEGYYEYQYTLIRDRNPSLGPEDRIYEVKLDKNPPYTHNVSVSGLTATITIKDDASGIVSYSFSEDGKELISKTSLANVPEVTYIYKGSAGTHTLMMNAMDGANKWPSDQQVTFTLTTPYVPPVSTYYTVTLPEITGATLSKRSGNHTVEEGYSFSFTLTLDDAYSHAQPVVTTSRKGGTEVLVADTLADGRLKYKIRSVEEDIALSITNLNPNDDPTANAPEPTGANSLRVVGGTAWISVVEPCEVRLYTLSGYLIRHLRIPAGSTSLPLPQGVSILQVGTVRYKVIGR